MKQRGMLFFSLATVLAALVLFTIVFSAILLLGWNSSLTWWTREEGARIRTLAVGLLQEMAERGQPLEAAPLRTALQDGLHSDAFVLVSRPDETAVFTWRGGQELQGQGRNFARRHQAETERIVISGADGRPYAFLVAGVTPIQELDSVRYLGAALIANLAWGLAAGMALALAAALFLARKISRQAGALSMALQRMGARSLVTDFPPADIRELQEITVEARNLQDRLHHEEGLRAQWAADIAHDLRTPITSLKLQFEGMMEGALSIDQPRIQKNYRELLRMEHLVRDLAMLTRLENPGYQLELECVAMADLAADLEHRFALSAAEYGRSLVLGRVEGGCQADYQLLLRASANVVDNALRYAQGGGDVELDLASDGGEQACLRVSNPGTISAEVRERMFDRLYRASGARQNDGSGLGLAITKAAIELMGGAVAVRIDQDAGRTVVELRLPACASLPDLYPA